MLVAIIIIDIKLIIVSARTYIHNESNMHKPFDSEAGSKFTGEHQGRSAISIKLLWNFIEIILRHECSPANLLHV